jgi:hypothetical protein
MANHDPLARSDRMMGIHPKPQLGKVESTIPVLEIQFGNQGMASH